jgi:predicted lipoprotein with Yx(FWY)xxD motif
MRADGSTQLQIAGHPLYRFAGDTKAGDTNGQGILNLWHAAGPDGNKVS